MGECEPLAIGLTNEAAEEDGGGMSEASHARFSRGVQGLSFRIPGADGSSYYHAGDGNAGDSRVGREGLFL